MFVYVLPSLWVVEGLASCHAGDMSSCDAIGLKHPSKITNESIPGDMIPDNIWTRNRPPCKQSFAVSAKSFYKGIHFARWVNDYNFKQTLNNSWLSDGNCMSFAWGLRMEYAYRYMQVPNDTTDCIVYYVGHRTVSQLE